MFDADPSKHVRLWEGVNAKTGARFRCAACRRCSWRGRTRRCSGASDLKALNSSPADAVTLHAAQLRRWRGALPGPRDPVPP